VGVDLSAVDEPLLPGLHLEDDVDPLARAKQVAADLDGDLCETQEDVDELLAVLRALPPLDADGIRTVQALSQRVAAAERIVERTVDRAAADVSERLAASGSGVAVHPEAVRARAAGLVQAQERLRQAEERLETARDEEVAVAPEPPAPAPAAVPPPEEAAAPPPRRRWWQRRGRRRREVEDTSESTSLLQQVAATTDEAFGARRASAARADLLVLLQAQRDRAEEQVRVAQRAWQDLAGDDRVEDVEAVVQRFDPQHQEARELAREAVGVRAVAPLLARALSSWSAGWEALGAEPPAAVDHDWVAALAERLTRPVVLVGDAVEGLEPLVAAAPAAPVVVVEELG
jgi:hypothetical protein